VNGSGPATQWIPVQTFANDLDGILLISLYIRSSNFHINFLYLALGEVNFR